MKLLLVFAAVLCTVSTAPQNVKRPSDEDEKSLELMQVSDLPKYINWVEKGAVTSVKDQGHCGSAYAFSAAGALEGLFYMQNKTLTEVSVQELIDCSQNDGCEGGYMMDSFQYVISRPGINSEMSYPYIAKEHGKCLAKKNESAGTCTSYNFLPESGEKALQKVVATVGPVSSVVAVTPDFMNYKGGIFKGKCAVYLNHPVLVVGYGTDNVTNEDYWLVKNSWGTAWGENGYIRMIRHVNICGIAEIPSYPIYQNN